MFSDLRLADQHRDETTGREQAIYVCRYCRLPMPDDDVSARQLDTYRTPFTVLRRTRYHHQGKIFPSSSSFLSSLLSPPLVLTMRQTTKPSFTDELRAAAGEQWDRIINHKFTTELASGKIDRNGKSPRRGTSKIYSHQ